jgi:hypothetical protein
VTSDPNNFAFTLDDAGTYLVTLTATDAVGVSGSGSIEVDVQDVPPAVYLLNGSAPAGVATEDPTFGGGRPVITTVSPDGNGGSLGVAVNPSTDPAAAGKILSVDTTDAPGGNLALVQYNADGTLDSTFGSNGIALANFPGSANAFALDANGKILVAGQISSNNGDFALARYLTQDTVINGVTYHAGDLDPTFGNGGLVTTDFVGGQDNAVYGVNVTETTDSTQADVVVNLASSTALGGVADGVLGCESDGQITLVSGWAWYAGADPAQVGAGQYDFETVLIHELGHAPGWGTAPAPPR